MAQPQPQTTATTASLPTTVDQLSAAVTVVFVAAEGRLVTGSATLVQAAIANPALAPSLRGRLQALSNEVSRDVLVRVRSMANTVADTAARNGNATAARDVRALERQVSNWVANPMADIMPHDVTASRL